MFTVNDAPRYGASTTDGSDGVAKATASMPPCLAIAHYDDHQFTLNEMPFDEKGCGHELLFPLALSHEEAGARKQSN